MRGACQVADLTLMIRATRGRSSRPYHMQSQFRSPEVATSVDLRRLAGDLHSVAKQASFNIAFEVDLEGFGRATWFLKFD